MGKRKSSYCSKVRGFHGNRYTRKKESCGEMASELSLTWDDHHKTLVGVLGKLLDTNTLVDCTIAAEGQYLKAHKIILSACSPYFELLFSQENEKNPIVVLTNIKFQELKAMIDFIYRGKVKVPEECLKDFVEASECLQIKGIGNGLRQEMSPQNTGNEDPATHRRGQSSPQPPKRMRPTDFGNGIEMSDASTVNEVNFESESCQGSSNGLRVDAPCSFRDETRLSLRITTNSLTSLPSSVCSEMKNLGTSESVLFEKSLTQCEEELPNPDFVVVKNEPEEDDKEEEVFIPKLECYIEPKVEEISEDVGLEGAAGETNSEPGTNQFPAFSTMSQSTTMTPERVLVPQVMETTSSLGAVHRVSDDTAEAALDPGEGVSAPSAPKVQAFRPHSCLDCGKAFASPSHLARHRMTHAKKRPFICDVCGKAFTSKDHLQAHSRLHTGERPFVCEICGRMFTTIYKLQLHSRVHMGSVICDVCGKTFTSKEDLQEHFRVHSGERPHKCDLCGTCFTHLKTLQVHRRLHTRVHT